MKREKAINHEAHEEHEARRTGAQAVARLSAKPGAIRELPFLRALRVLRGSALSL
jgi:hypothetical protein